MLKKCITIFVIAAMILPVFGQAHAASSIPTAYGIDVSHHQGVIDWDTVAKHIDFAILRCGYGSDTTAQDDRQWKSNVEACTRLKIPFGVYIYSYATTPEEARSEAMHVLRLLKGYSPSMPVYLDLEDEKIANNCTPEQILANATIFCNLIREAGYTPGIYANTNWWTNYLSSPQYDQWDRWVARYNSQLQFNRPYSMWQYTSQGSVPGITGDVDMNYWYKEKPTVVGCTHSYTFRTQTEPTCTTPGIRLYTCSLCGDTYEEKISPKGHNYGKTVIPPTCTQAGYTLYTCSKCGNAYRAEEVPGGHNWDEGTVTVAPTENTKGEKVYTCSGCDQTMTVTIPALGNHEEHCPSAGFLDVPPYGNWAHEGIDFALEQGLFQGVSNTLFAPEKTMTRAMLVTVLWRNAGSPQETNADYTAGNSQSDPADHTAGNPQGTPADHTAGNPQGTIANYMDNGTQDVNADGTDNGAQDVNADGTDYTTQAVSSDFTDVPPGQWYTQAVAWASANGIVNGVGQGRFAPMGQITREQLATILYRYVGEPKTEGEEILTPFPDRDAVSPYAQKPLAWALSQGLLKGVQTEGVLYLRPQGSATRAQTATILYRWLSQWGEAPMQ